MSQGAWVIKSQTEPRMLMFTGSFVRMYSFLTTQNSIPPCTGVTLSCLQPFTQLTDSSAHKLILRLIWRPWYIWQLGCVTKSSKSVLFFFLLLLAQMHLPIWFHMNSSLSYSIPLFLFPLQSFATVLVSISLCPVGDSGIRGIPEGDFPCFILSVWSLKTCLLPKTKVQVTGYHVTLY